MPRQPYQRQPRRVVEPTYLDNPPPGQGGGAPPPAPTMPPPPPMQGQQEQAAALRGPSMPRPVRRPPGQPPINKGGQSIADRANSPRGGAPKPPPPPAPAYRPPQNNMKPNYGYPRTPQNMVWNPMKQNYS